MNDSCTGYQLQRYLDAVMEERLFSNRENLRFHMRTVFEGVHLHHQHVLDVGGGSGLYSFYAACQGAKKVVCLEPEAFGSRPGMNAAFHRLQQRLGCANVELQPVTLQAFDPGSERFNLILCHNSVNHLDERACIALRTDPSAKASYRALFAKLYSLCAPGRPCSSATVPDTNLFPLLGLRNPFAPTIEWHKRQSPRLWAALLTAAGFVHPQIRWLSLNSLRRVGRPLLGNRVMAFFFRSDFGLTMKKPSA